MDDGWIVWKGGAMPSHIPNDVEVRYRAPANSVKGVGVEWPILPLFLNWSHDGEDDDIIAYREVND